ncbi:hypothetical protein FB639_006559, partial [Coemansia asiatica]
LQFLSIVDFDLNIQPEVLQAIGADLFSGRLPKLTNVYRDVVCMHTKLDSAFSPTQLLTVTATEQQQQQQQMPHNYSYTAAQHNPSRPLSYPGPNGVFYSNPSAPRASNIYKYRNIHDQMASKTLVNTAGRNNMQSTDSTLTSSSPGDTTAISALHHGIL